MKEVFFDSPPLITNVEDLGPISRNLDDTITAYLNTEKDVGKVSEFEVLVKKCLTLRTELSQKLDAYKLTLELNREDIDQHVNQIKNNLNLIKSLSHDPCREAHEELTIQVLLANVRLDKLLRLCIRIKSRETFSHARLLRTLAALSSSIMSVINFMQCLESDRSTVIPFFLRFEQVIKKKVDHLKHTGDTVVDEMQEFYESAPKLPLTVDKIMDKAFSTMEIISGFHPINLKDYQPI